MGGQGEDRPEWVRVLWRDGARQRVLEGRGKGGEGRDKERRERVKGRDWKGEVRE